MSQTVDDPNACPVCTWSTAGGPSHCPWCHWPLDDRRSAPAELQRRLEQARFRLDMRAARAASHTDTELDELAGLVRGLPPAGPDPSQRSGVPLEADVPQRVLRLIREAEHFAELRFGLDDLSLVSVHRDEFGVPRRGPQKTWRWAELAELEGVDVSTVRFHLAGGIGTRPITLPGKLAATILRNLPDLGLQPWMPLLVVPPNALFRVPLQVAESLARMHSLVVWAPMPAGRIAAHDLDTLLRTAPLRHDFELVLLTVNQHGQVRPTTRPLFAAGSVVNGSGPLQAQVDVVVPALTTGPVSLPVVVRFGEEVGKWKTVCVPKGRLEAGAKTRLRFTFAAPDGLALPDLPDWTWDAGDGWRGELGLVPTKVDGELLDLVCAVELCEPEAKHRFALLAETLELVAAVAAGGGVRVAIARYGQHRKRADRSGAGYLAWRAFTSPASAAGSVRALEAAANDNDHAAAAEDMLQLVGQATWRREARRVLLVVGSRPPYPSRQDTDRAHPCERRLDWKALARGLRRQGVQMIGVRQQPVWKDLRPGDTPLRERWHHFWREISGAGLFELPGVTPPELVRALGVELTRQLGDIPFALAVPGGPTD